MLKLGWEWRKRTLFVMMSVQSFAGAAAAGIVVQPEIAAAEDFDFVTVAGLTRETQCTAAAEGAPASFVADLGSESQRIVAAMELGQSL